MSKSVFNRRHNINRKAQHYKPGHWRVICDRCGVRRDISEMKTEWQGFFVCETCYEEKQPLLDEGLYQTPETGIPDITRPENRAEFKNNCTSLGVQCIPGYAVAGCVQVGRNDGIEMINVYLSAGGT